MDCPPPQWVPGRSRVSSSERQRATSETSSGRRTTLSTSRRGPLPSDPQPSHPSRTGSSSSYDTYTPVNASFSSSLNSPTASFTYTPVTSRQPSVVSSVSDKLTELRSRFGKQNPKKLAKKEQPPPKRSDQLDKPGTQKLTKFWDSLYRFNKAGQGPPNSTADRRVSTNESQASEELTGCEFLLDPLPPPNESLPSLHDIYLPHNRPLTINDPLPQPLVDSDIDLDPTGRFHFHPCLSSISEIAQARREPFLKMDYTRLVPESRLAADQKDKARRMKDAQSMYETIKRNAERSNTTIPPYHFLELIGKGSYGRVYKCRDQRSSDLVAIKIADVEFEDWAHKWKLDDDREGAIRDFRKEVNILQTLKDNNAKNVNVIRDAFDLHSQLWIVADYCTGGSVRTLQRPFHKDGRAAGLPEHFIIPIARELAVAMKSIHEMGIVHRDIKCANVYITEDGTLQLGDFGVTGIMENDRHAKRKTIVGTPHWMPPELMEAFETGIKEEGYGTEVDIYSYGAIIIEMATGNPPLHQYPKESLAEVLQMKMPRLEDQNYSSELRDLANICLSADAMARPSADEILKHPAIAGTSKTHPTRSLVRLIETFKLWEHGGGSRVSLWITGPTDRPAANDEEAEFHASDGDDADGWNFSTSDDFDRRFSLRPTLSENDLQYLQAPHGAGLPPGAPPIDTQGISVAERIKREHSELSANRGEKLLAPLYNINDPSGYRVSTPQPVDELPAPSTDLPLRNFTAGAPMRESMIEIDLDEAGAGDSAPSAFALHMDAISEDTIRPMGRRTLQDDEDEDDFEYARHDDGAEKRATMEWTFPSALTTQPKRDTMAWTFPATQGEQPKRDTMEWTFQTAGPAPFEESTLLTDLSSAPVDANFSHGINSSAHQLVRNSTNSIVDLNLGITDQPRRLEDPSEIVRPTTASSTAESVMTDTTSGNPFDLEDDPVQNELDRQRFSYHKQWQSEGGHLKRHSHKTMAMHARGTSLSSTDSQIAPINNGTPAMSSNPQPQSSLASDTGHHNVEIPTDDTTQWPHFSEFDTFDTSPIYQSTLNEGPRLGESVFPHDRDVLASGSGSQLHDSSTVSMAPGIPFPEIRAPNPDALAENADPQLLEDELFRSLDDLASGFKAVELALHQHVKFDTDDLAHSPSSDTESGFESTRDGTEDEGRVDQLTTRRNKPRNLETRSPPGPGTVGSVQ